MEELDRRTFIAAAAAIAVLPPFAASAKDQLPANWGSQPLPDRFEFIGPKYDEGDWIIEETGEVAGPSWSFGWKGWVRDTKYGEFVLLNENPEANPVLFEKLKEITVLQAKRSRWQIEHNCRL